MASASPVGIINRRKPGAGRPRKACSVCKAQKIRCTEERPSCRRCVRLQHRCTYDPPAERGRGGSGSGRQNTRKASQTPHQQVVPLPPDENIGTGTSPDHPLDNERRYSHVHAAAGDSTTTDHKSVNNELQGPTSTFPVVGDHTPARLQSQAGETQPLTTESTPITHTHRYGNEAANRHRQLPIHDINPSHSHSQSQSQILLQQPQDVTINSAGTASSNALYQYLAVSDSVLLELIDIYFDHVYNSHLLLHKPSFLTCVLEGRACAHVLLSVCAWGAKYYQDARGATVLKDRGLMNDWAERAGVLAYQSVENMAQENIVTFMNLALFWHSMGFWRRAYLHKGTAFLLPDILGLGPKAVQGANSLEAEVRRRYFWACYVMHAHTAEKSPRFEPRGSVLTLPLPWSDEDFSEGVCRRPQIPSLSSPGGESDGSLYACLIRATTFWSSVACLLKFSDPSLHSRVPAILSLEERLQNWWQESVPSELKLNPHSGNAVSCIPRSVLHRVLHLNSLYHQTLCSLHASIVPLFSGVPGGGWASVRQMSAQRAFEHAGQMSALIAAVLNADDETRGEGRARRRTSLVPMFMGYAAYCGCAVQIPFMWCANPEVRVRVHANVRANTKLLQVMGGDWKFASMLNICVHYLYAMHRKSAVVLDDEPKNISRDKLACLNREVANTRASIFEYLHMLRNDEGGYGSPTSPDEEEGSSSVGNTTVNVSESHVTDSSESLQETISKPESTAIADGAAAGINISTDSYQPYQEPDANYPIAAAAAAADGDGGMLDLMNPFFDTETTFGLSSLNDEEMLDFEADLGQLDFVNFDMATGWVQPP
ncbi:hypothetical protein F5Y17DRAFT_442748 [Xylariaceae sp. FL0594]|nr:hypothetical protein F5Y17DRAFT_442748 [Xylariaceae sp. FL0594]